MDSPGPLSVYLLQQIRASGLSEQLLLLWGVTVGLSGEQACAEPSCSDMSVTEACPLNFSPVCGSNGVTYANECALCVHRLQTNADILIVKEGSC
uniref:Kazal-like domain-containing protein n=1 Tax=Myripristis murdjan TaxID=586833 RepID=A0A667YNE4_9TELE